MQTSSSGLGVYPAFQPIMDRVRVKDSRVANAFSVNAKLRSSKSGRMEKKGKLVSRSRSVQPNHQRRGNIPLQKLCPLVVSFISHYSQCLCSASLSHKYTLPPKQRDPRRSLGIKRLCLPEFDACLIVKLNNFHSITKCPCVMWTAQIHSKASGTSYMPQSIPEIVV